MAKPMQSVDPTLLALQVANTATQNAKKKVLPSLTTQAPIQSSLNAPKQQTQAISTNITPPTAKIGGISSPFGATNINSSPVLGGATPQEIGTVSKQLQSLPKAMPETGTSTEVNRDETLGQLIGNIDQGDDFQTIQTKYPELKGLDEESLGQLVGNIDQGDSVDVILQKFPELQGGQKDNFITNLGSGIAGTAAATGQLGKNLAFKAVDLYRTKVQGKEKLTPEQIAMAEQSPMGQNLSSITNRQTEAQKKSAGGQIGTAVGTLGQAFSMPTGVGSLFKIPAIANIAKKAPIILSMIKGGLQGVVGQDQYTLMTEGRQSTAEERSIAGGIGLAFPLLGAIIKATKPFVQKGIKSAVNTLQTSGIINPAKFDQIKSQLIAEGVEGMEKATVDDVANFLTERGIKGTRQQQADILEEVANKSRLAKKEVLDLSTNLHAPDSAKVLAQTLVDELGTAKSQATKAIASKAQQLLNKLDNGGATLNEIDDLRAMGRKELNTRTSAGNVKISQQDVDNLIGEVRGYIEDAAQKEGLPQLVGYQGEKNLIKMLNNQTSTAKGLAEGILRRDSTDAVQQLMTFMSARGGGVIAGGLAGSQGGMFDNNTTAGKIGNIAVGAFLGGIVDNPKIKSNVAQYLNKLTGTQKGAILKRMESGGKELLERKDKDVINGLKNIIMSNNKEIPNSLPFKPNANTTINDITTSTMGNSNKAGVILSEGGIVPPKPTPKTPPITVEKGAIGMGTPKVNNTPVIPPKATVAPSVSTPKIDTFKRMTELDSNPLYKKQSFKETNYGRNAKGLETEYGTVEKVNVNNRYDPTSYTINGKDYSTSEVKDFWKKQTSDELAAVKVNRINSDAATELRSIEKSPTTKTYGSNLKGILDELGIKDVNSIPEGTESDILQMVRARKPVAPKKGMPKLGKEIMGQDLVSEAKKYKSAEEFISSKGKPLYHGTQNSFDEFKSEYIGKATDPGIIGEGFYFTNNKRFADLYAKGDTTKVINSYIDTDKIFDLGTVKTQKQASDLFGIKEDDFYKAGDGKIIPKNFKVAKVFGEKLKQMGYDGASFERYPGSIETVIFNPKNIQTESQLKQIREQANKKPLPAKGLPKLPKGEVLEQNYGVQHRPSKSAPSYNLAFEKLVPDDIYTNPEYYADMTDKAYKESFSVIKKIKGSPDAEVVLYRATPKNELNNGDWVSLSKEYAKREAMTEGVKVHEFKVKAKDIYRPGDDINEFGYFGDNIKKPLPPLPKKGLPKLGKEIMEQDMGSIDNNLIQEAKKYKSADEFIKAEPVLKVKIESIKPTEGHTQENTLGINGVARKEFRNKPILVEVDSKDPSKLYILDGNHRYFEQLSRGDKEVTVKVNGKGIDTDGYKARLKQIREQANKKTLPPLPNKGK